MERQDPLASIADNWDEEVEFGCGSTERNCGRFRCTAFDPRLIASRVGRGRVERFLTARMFSSGADQIACPDSITSRHLPNTRGRNAVQASQRLQEVMRKFDEQAA